MERCRFNAFASVLATIAVTLSGCDSGNTASAPGASPGGAPSTVSCAGKKTLRASGSTAQANAMTRFTKAFELACPGQTLNYTANGSGAGISEFTSDQTDFGGSDSPLSPSEYAAAQQRCGAPVWNLPVVFGPVVITYHVKGVSTLILDAPTTARIFNGGITRWDDPALAARNPGVNLPAEPIHVVFRSDQSGTSDNFQRYLDTAGNGGWGKGAGKTFRGGVGEGAMGNDGAATAVERTEGAISYNEWAFALAHHLDTAKVITSAGPDPVTISTDSVGKTIAAAAFINPGNDLVLDTIGFYLPKQAGAYPIVLATYEVVCSKYPDAQIGVAVRAFLQSTIGAGQDGLADNGYIPIPDAFRTRLSTAVNALS